MICQEINTLLKYKNRGVGCVLKVIMFYLLFSGKGQAQRTERIWIGLRQETGQTQEGRKGRWKRKRQVWVFSYWGWRTTGVWHRGQQIGRKLGRPKMGGKGHVWVLSCWGWHTTGVWHRGQRVFLSYSLWWCMCNNSERNKSCDFGLDN